MIDIRGGIIAVTIAIVVALIADRPAPVKDNQVPFCMQPVWDEYGREIGGRFTECANLDRYEFA